MFLERLQIVNYSLPDKTFRFFASVPRGYASGQIGYIGSVAVVGLFYDITVLHD